MPKPNDKKPTRMKSFRLTEISAVGRPAQEGAVVTMMKGHDPAKGVGADDKPRRLKRINLSEISVVSMPAQQHARVRVTKGDDVAKLATALTGTVAGHQHGLALRAYDGRLHVGVDHATAEGSESPHTHAVTLGEDGALVLASDSGHTHPVPPLDEMLAGLSKQVAQTSQAQGHTHPVTITGNDSGLRLVLGEYKAEGASHTHEVVRVRGGWQVGMARKHTHTLPDLGRVITGLLEADPDADMGKAETGVTDGHLHGVALAKGGGFVLNPSGSDAHTHAITKDGKVAPTLDGHTHTLASQAHLRKALAGSSPASQTGNTPEGPTMTTDTPLQKAEADYAKAEQDLHALAAEVLAAHPDQDEAWAFKKAYQSAEGQKCRRRMQNAEQAAYLAKSTDPDELDFEERRSARIDEIAKSRTPRWASKDEAAAIRSQVVSEFFGSSEYRAMRRKFKEAQMAKHAPPEPELQAVAAGLISKSEAEADPEAALDKLIAQVAYHKGISVAEVTKEFYKPDSLGHDLLLKARAHANRRL